MGAMRAMRAIARDASDATGVATMDANFTRAMGAIDATAGNSENPRRGFFDAIFISMNFVKLSCEF
jgi:hypothetical protein